MDTSPHLNRGMRAFLPLLAAALVSVVFYGVVYGFMVRKPLSIGIIGEYFNRKIAYAESIHQPKLMILAGSGGRYSHRCEVLAHELKIPCVNGSINAHVGIDLLFEKYKPTLKPGDTVYLPLEFELYEWDKDTVDSCESSAYLAEYEPMTLMRMGPVRSVEGFFYFDLPYLFSGLAEEALARAGMRRKAGINRLFGLATMNQYGDETGHTSVQGEEYQHIINSTLWQPPDPAKFTLDRFYSAGLVRDFIRWAAAHDIHVIGGLPTSINDTPLSLEVVQNIRRLYESEGASFVALDNLSQYPRRCFYDSIHHLNEECQVRHSQALAGILGPALKKVSVESLPR